MSRDVTIPDAPAAAGPAAGAGAATPPFVEIRGLSVAFRTTAGEFYAVDRLDLAVARGEIFGIVGESGSGKTMTGLALLGLLPPAATAVSTVMRIGDTDLRSGRWDAVRGRRVAMIFQDPAAALNPVATIGVQIDHVLRRHTPLGRAARRERARELLGAVRLPEPEAVLGRYPHELSGGMQQRGMIAIALAAGADVLVADEPTTALDVTIQAQILALLNDLRLRLGLTILMITHDLGVVAALCDRAAVMQAGRVVETGAVPGLLIAPEHPYTRSLIAALPGSRRRAAGAPA